MRWQRLERCESHWTNVILENKHRRKQNLYFPSTSKHTLNMQVHDKPMRAPYNTGGIFVLCEICLENKVLLYG